MYNVWLEIKGIPWIKHGTIFLVSFDDNNNWIKGLANEQWVQILQDIYFGFLMVMGIESRQHLNHMQLIEWLPIPTIHHILINVHWSGPHNVVCTTAEYNSTTWWIW